MMLFLLKESDFKEFISNIQKVYRFYSSTTDLRYKALTTPEEVSFTPRSIQPLKMFFVVDSQVLSDSSLQRKIRKRVIFNVKNCDLKALRILDGIFFGDIVDPFYEKMRDNTIIISTDCVEPAQNCFCELLGYKPYPENGFDLNISFCSEGAYVVECATKKGEEIVEINHYMLSEVTDSELEMRKAMRKNSSEKVKMLNSEHSALLGKSFQKIVSKNFFSQKWSEFSKNCVQCLGCNLVCPSCFCFYISEEEEGKVRRWDGCLSTSYARVAGGLNPRAKLFERMRNRFQCKFNYRVINFGMYACYGCGRCIDVCPGKIDIRKCLSDLI